MKTIAILITTIAFGCITAYAVSPEHIQAEIAGSLAIIALCMILHVLIGGSKQVLKELGYGVSKRQSTLGRF